MEVGGVEPNYLTCNELQRCAEVEKWPGIGRFRFCTRVHRQALKSKAY